MKVFNFLRKKKTVAATEVESPTVAVAFEGSLFPEARLERVLPLLAEVGFTADDAEKLRATIAVVEKHGASNVMWNSVIDDVEFHFYKPSHTSRITTIELTGKSGSKHSPATIAQVNARLAEVLAVPAP